MMAVLPQVIRRQERAYRISRDCDCACPDVVPTQGLYSKAVHFEDLCLSSRVQSIPLSSEYRVVFVPSGDATVTDSIAVLNQVAWDFLSCFTGSRKNSLPWSEWRDSWGQQVVEGIIFDLAELGFLASRNTKESTFVELSNTLSAWLHVTDRCNLRCSYCYFPHRRVDMAVKTGQAAIDATFRSAQQHGYQRVKLKYAGGEPLLRFPEIVDMQRYAQALGDRFEIRLESVILSNGTLLNKQIVQAMQSLNLHLMISLDGLHDAHDRQRPFADGVGSSAEVRRAIELALSCGLKPDLSITISGRNIDGMPELIKWILGQDLPFGLNFYRENDLSASHEDLKLEEDRIIAGMLAAYKIIEMNMPRRTLLASLIDRANLSAPHVRACGVGHSYLVFDSDGQVSKCQMAMHEKVAFKDDNDLLQAVRLATDGVINPTVSQKSGCCECTWQNWCAGGCPLATYRATGRYDVKSPFCNIYKALFPAAIRLEGLRLLQYQQ